MNSINSIFHIEAHFEKIGEIAKIGKLLDGSYLISYIEHDDLAESPRHHYEPIGSILFHPSYSIVAGKKDEIINLKISQGNSPDEHFDKIRKKQLGLQRSDIAFFAPISSYDHGTKKLSLGYKYGWDYGVIGFAVLTKDDVKNAFGCIKTSKKYIDQAVDLLKGEVADLNAWINGDCYRIRLNRVNVVNGKVNILDDFDDIPQDGNFFNKTRALQCANELFDSLGLL